MPVWNRKTGTYARAANGRPIVSVMDDAKHSRPWKDRISALAVQVCDGLPVTCPVRLTLAFVMPRPKSHFGTRKGETYLRPDAPTWHTSKPDATKLVRAVEDALTNIVWTDDCLVVEQSVSKLYGVRVGVDIRVEAVAC